MLADAPGAQRGTHADARPRCAGTNFLVRAKAFMEAGGSPTYTLTEDFALGMELKKLGWQCRYVQEYLAVGEAPSEIRNCFQQRSRWTKVRQPHPPGPCPLGAVKVRALLLGMAARCIHVCLQGTVLPPQAAGALLLCSHTGGAACAAGQIQL